MLGSGKEGYEPSPPQTQPGTVPYSSYPQPQPAHSSSSGTYQAVPVAQAYQVQHAVPVAQTVQYQTPAVAAVVVSSTPRGDQGWYDRSPRRIVCQYCSYEVITSVQRSPGIGAWFWAFILFFFGCWPCCLIPFCLDDCQDAVHYCPNCRRPVGEKRSF